MREARSVRGPQPVVGALALLCAFLLAGTGVGALAGQPARERKGGAGKKGNAKKGAGAKRRDAGKKRKAAKKGGKHKPAGGKRGAQKAGGGPRRPTRKPAPEAPKADKPVLAPWDEASLDDKGRIGGSLKHCPGCQIEVLGSNGLAVKMLSVKRADPDYQVEWLEPGTYMLRVTGGGCSVSVPNVSVQAMSDTRVDIEFAPSGAQTKGTRPRSTAPRIERWPTWRPRPEPKVPVRNFKPKSFKELERLWNTGNPSRGKRKKHGKGHRHSGKGGKQGKGKRAKGKK